MGKREWRLILTMPFLLQNLWGGTIANWNGGTGNWSNSANWTPNGIPDNGASTYTAVINAGVASVVTLDINSHLDALTLGATSGSNTSTLNIAAESLTLGNATTVPLLTNNAKGVLNVGGGGSINFDLSSGNSTAGVNNGAINLNGGTLAVVGGTSNSLTIGGTGTLTLAGGSIQGTGSEGVTINGGITGPGSVSNLASFQVNNSIAPGAGQNFTASQVGNLILNGGSGTGLNLNGGAFSTTGNLTLAGCFAGTSLANGATATVGGAVNIAASSYFGNGLSTSGTGSSFASNGANFNGAISVGAGSNVDFRGGAWTPYDAATNTLANRQLTLGGNLYFDGGPVYTANGGLTLQGGALLYGPGAGTNALANLTTASGVTVTGNTNVSFAPVGGVFSSGVTVGTSGVTDSSSVTQRLDRHQRQFERQRRDQSHWQWR